MFGSFFHFFPFLVHPFKEYKTKAKHSWGFIHIPAHITPPMLLHYGGLLLLLQRNRHISWLPTHSMCSFHTPEDCSKHYKISKFKHQNERKAGALGYINSWWKDRLYLLKTFSCVTKEKVQKASSSTARKPFSSQNKGEIKTQEGSKRYA